MSEEEQEHEYIISNLTKFLDASRVWLYVIFGGEEPSKTMTKRYVDLNDEEKEEIDKVLSIKEVITISSGYIKHNLDNDTWTITEKEYEDFLVELSGRMTSNLLASMVSSGILESAYDSEINDFVFWRNDTDEKDNNK